MNPLIGWGLAAIGVALAWWQYGGRGVLLAVSVIVFWLLLQFSRALRVMRTAGQRPVGRVDSAVMLNARLRAGMTLMQVIPLTRSLGERIGVGDDPEHWRWTDDGGAAVDVALRGGRVEHWTLARPADDEAPAADQVAAADGAQPAPAGTASGDAVEPGTPASAPGAAAAVPGTRSR
jgi:hypothetical protein